jgi:hypothetical protein
MLVRSSFTPILGALHASSDGGGHSQAVHFADSCPTVAYHPPAISCSLSCGGGGGSDHERSRGSGLCRTCSDGNLSSLGGCADDHHRSRAPLETIQSFAARDGSWDEEEGDNDHYDEGADAEEEMSFGMFGDGGGGGGGSGSTYTQEHPLFLARGLGIDRLRSRRCLLVRPLRQQRTGPGFDSASFARLSPFVPRTAVFFAKARQHILFDWDYGIITEGGA